MKKRSVTNTSAAPSPSRAVLAVTSSSVEETQAFGERLGRVLQAGDVVALSGELGSGKTTLIQGIAKGLARDPSTIKSPTFVLMREYPGDVPLVHIDAYRLAGASAASWLDIDLMFSPRKITLIEWAERCEGALPAEHLTVQMTHVSAHRRRIELTSSDRRAREMIEQVKMSDTRLKTQDSSQALQEETDETPGD